MAPLYNRPIVQHTGAFNYYRLLAQLWVFKAFVGIVFSIFEINSKSQPPTKKPTLIKSYSPLPNHKVRIFIPHTYKAGGTPLPTLIDIHGGGFCIGAPVGDDNDNILLCHTHGFLVISIPYRLGPRYRFPTAPNDCTAMIRAVLDDESLPIDRDKVALVGYSAGGNLALAAAQMEGVKGKIKAVVGYYPVVNQALDLATKEREAVLPPDGNDALRWLAPMFHHGYTINGMDTRDPLLSPAFAKREDLPRSICLIGCEYDILCYEAKEMARELAESETGERIPLSNGKNGWTKGHMRWELIEGALHGFNQQRKGGELGKIYMEKTIEMHNGVAEWLNKQLNVL
jgi:acetyl esterase/lipase